MQKKNSGRPNKVAVEIKKALSESLLRDSFVDEEVNAALISITDVTVSSCLQHAKIYIASLSPNVSNDKCLRFLQKHVSHLKHCVGEKVLLKFVPNLSFFIDNSFDRGNRIESLLKETAGL